MDRLYSFVDAVKVSYHNDTPYHCLEEKDHTVFYALTYDEYHAQSTDDLQTHLQMHHLVITGHPFSSLKFDGPGLRSMKALTAIISIEGKLPVILTKREKLISK